MMKTRGAGRSAQPTPAANTDTEKREMPGWLLAPWFLPLALAVLTLVVLGPTLFSIKTLVLSDPAQDLATEFIYWRQFGFDQLRAGHIALWNPYVYSGTPFLGGWQGGLFYPPDDVLYMTLPLYRAINAEFALHVFIAGLGMAMWARYHRLHPIAALTAGAILMFCGPFFPHIFAGHLATMDAMAWVPYVLLAVDGLLDSFAPVPPLPSLKGRDGKELRATSAKNGRNTRVGKDAKTPPPAKEREALSSVRPIAASGERSHALSPSGKETDDQVSAAARASRRRGIIKWGLLATVALSLELLAGHPQTLFNTVVTVILYFVVRLISSPRQIGGALVMAIAGMATVCVCSVQIVAGFAAAAEGTRQSGVPYSFATMFPFPPDNFITLVAPTFYGGMRGDPYWGHAYLWEVCLYCGTAGLILAILGLTGKANPLRLQWTAMIVLLMWIALGSNTPLFHFLYTYVPGFNRFRVHTKFIYEAALFIVIGAGYGVDALICERRVRFAAAVAAVGAVIAIVGAVMTAGMLGHTTTSTWQGFVEWVWRGHDNPIIHTPQFLHDSQRHDGLILLLSALVMVSVGAYSGLVRNNLVRGCGIAAIAIVEMSIFASANVATFDPAKNDTPVIQQTIAAEPGDYRVLDANSLKDNQMIRTHSSDIWGYDPTVLGRYAEYMQYSQKGNTSEASMYLTFAHDSPMFRLFRLKYLFPNLPNMPPVLPEPIATLPHIFLAGSVTTMPKSDDMLAAIADPSFDFTNTVILETPGITVDPNSTTGTVYIRQESPGVLTITADVPGQAVAVITDAYSRYWKATPLAGSSQHSYDVLPADYAAMAVPLQPGHHSFRLTYMPDGFIASAWVSGVSTLLLLALAIWFLVGELPPPQSTMRITRSSLHRSPVGPD